MRQARIAVEDTGDVSALRLAETLRIFECGVCKQTILYSDVTYAVAWGCWKTYASRPERDAHRQFVAVALGDCFAIYRRLEDSATVHKATFASAVALNGPHHLNAVIAVNRLASVLCALGCYTDAKRYLESCMPAKIDPKQSDALEFRARHLRAWAFAPDSSAFQVSSTMLLTFIGALNDTTSDVEAADDPMPRVEYELGLVWALLISQFWFMFTLLLCTVPGFGSLLCSGIARSCCEALVVTLFFLSWWFAASCAGWLLGKKLSTRSLRLLAFLRVDLRDEDHHIYGWGGVPLRADDPQVPPVHAPGYLGVGLLLFLFWSRQPDMDTYLARTVVILAGLFVCAAIISYNRRVRRALPLAIGPPLVPLLSIISANRFCPAYARSVGIASFVLFIAFWIVVTIRGFLVSRDQKME